MDPGESGAVQGAVVPSLRAVGRSITFRERGVSRMLRTASRARWRVQSGPVPRRVRRTRAGTQVQAVVGVGSPAGKAAGVGGTSPVGGRCRAGGRRSASANAAHPAVEAWDRPCGDACKGSGIRWGGLVLRGHVAISRGRASRGGPLGSPSGIKPRLASASQGPIATSRPPRRAGR